MYYIVAGILAEQPSRSNQVVSPSHHILYVVQFLRLLKCACHTLMRASYVVISLEEKKKTIFDGDCKRVVVVKGHAVLKKTREKCFFDTYEPGERIYFIISSQSTNTKAHGFS